MGLDACVRGGTREMFEDETGRWEYEHPLISVRLGNIAMISYLRRRVADILPEDSIVRQKVIYSGSHTGDQIDAELVSKLKTELDALQCDVDPDVQKFRKSMNELVHVALSTNRPIEF